MAVATEKRRLLWISPDGMPLNVSAALGQRWEVLACPAGGEITHQLRDADLALIAPPGDEQLDLRGLTDLLDQVDRSGAVAVVLLPGHLLADHVLARRRGQYVLACAEAPREELSARIEAAAALQPVIRHLQHDVAALRSFGDGNAPQFEELDEEMRLAARLQRDFLPGKLPEVGPVRFATLFRPATWVSGDLYDVFRLDEDHVGFYVADVVGHGLPAALLTLFIKRSLQTKRIGANSYQIVPPSETLALLNDDICQQGLTSCQFCTAFYGIIDVRTRRLRYTRGGHPAALWLGADLAPRRLEAVGPLLGVFPGESFELKEVSLNPGDRVIVYSDGAEEALAGPNRHDESAFVAECQRLREVPAEDMALQLAVRIDRLRRAVYRNDDVTVIVMDLLD